MSSRLPYQIEILRLVQALNRAQGQTVIMVLHDITLASRYADHVIGLKQGKLLFEGPPSDVVTQESLFDFFDAPLRDTRIDAEPGPVVLSG
ncbi:ABC transporter ATP-binding protein [Sagittula salina]|uniref:ABC transporter ATP-binding protein n=1 Tax=Sagittula salina TaxID=2820268 RepID=A0A940MUE2_9RHOB|nr:ABC transporter ATP-binding protein [Sagittula salina]MBP0484838.1 ABC transporter ATP-binding protein [Sagittula salina]